VVVVVAAAVGVAGEDDEAGDNVDIGIVVDEVINFPHEDDTDRVVEAYRNSDAVAAVAVVFAAAGSHEELAGQCRCHRFHSLLVADNRGRLLPAHWVDAWAGGTHRPSG